jgi:hypothetical protein
MPLQDHFHPLLSIRRHWQAFHNAWATYIASDLNRKLPPGYFAEPNVQFGIEIDIAAFQERTSDSRGSAPAWTPSAPTLTIPLDLATDIVEIVVYETEGGPLLAASSN